MSDLLTVEQVEEHARRGTILTLPQWTLFRCGWLFPDGHVQGTVYYRLGDGLGPTSRDRSTRDVLNEAVRWHAHHDGQQWGIEVLAVPCEVKP